MNRRGFLTAFATLAAGATMDPERLLWLPGRKLISIPAVVPARIYNIEGLDYQSIARWYADPKAARKAQIDRELARGNYRS